MSTEEPGRFCCGACEQVARAAEGKTSYTPSPAIRVNPTEPTPALVAVYGGRCRIDLTRGMRVTIGSAPTCDVPIVDPFLSQRTCELRVAEDGAVYIDDLDSACGTVVNDARITAPYRLHERDAIYIGKTVLMFSARVG